MTSTKTTITAWATALLLGLGGAASAQTVSPAGTADNTPAGSQPAVANPANTSHTGTDAIFDSRGRVLQAMVWEDNGHIVLSWSEQNGSAVGSQLVQITGVAADPDVVMARVNNTGKIYTDLVYTVDTGNGIPQTYYDVYEYVPTNAANSRFVRLAGFPLAVGDPTFIHLVPNIDSNDNGLVGLVWEQRRSRRAHVVVTSPEAPPEFAPIEYEQTITFDRSYLLMSDITGKVRSCSFNNGYSGAPLSTPGQLFEQTINPDVAVSQGLDDDAIVSTSFIRHAVDGRPDHYDFGDSLVIKQFAYGQCREFDHGNTVRLVEVNDGYSWGVHGFSTYPTPRIAARMGSEETLADVEVAMDWIQTQCAGGNTYQIRNYGKSNGEFRPVASGSVIPVNWNYASQPSFEPVVSYYGGGDGRYIITWSAAYTGDITQGRTNGFDIWAVTKEAGDFTYAGNPTPYPAEYGLVNRNVTGDQRFPSVAGRYLKKGLTAHLFVNQNDLKMAFKFSQGYAGAGVYLRPGAPAPATGAGTMAPLQAYPNPSDGAVNLQLQLRPGELVQQLVVFDALGRPVQQLSAAATETQNVVWKPQAQLPTGTYRVKMVTNQRVESIVVNRK